MPSQLRNGHFNHHRFSCTRLTTEPYQQASHASFFPALSVVQSSGLVSSKEFPPGPSESTPHPGLLWFRFFCYHKIPWQNKQTNKISGFIWLTIPSFSPSLWEHPGRRSSSQSQHSHNQELRGPKHPVLSGCFCSASLLHSRTAQGPNHEMVHTSLWWAFLSVGVVKTTPYRHAHIGPIWTILHEDLSF